MGKRPNTMRIIGICFFTIHFLLGLLVLAVVLMLLPPRVDVVTIGIIFTAYSWCSGLDTLREALTYH